MKTIVGIFLIVSISCNVKKDSNTGKADIENFHHAMSADEGYFLRCKMLNIDNLKSSTNHQIRVWIEFSLDRGKILELKAEREKWICKLHHFQFDSNEKNETMLIKHNVVESQTSLNPDVFDKKFERLGLYALNEGNRQQNFGLCNDGGGISIEIAEGTKYSEYLYPCWDAIEDQEEQNKIIGILKEIERKFKIRVFPLEGS